MLLDMKKYFIKLCRRDQHPMKGELFYFGRQEKKPGIMWGTLNARVG
jgi:hypothetical protein